MRVRFVYVRRRFVRMAEMRHGLATSNSNNFVVYDQKHKALVWVLVFLDTRDDPKVLIAAL